jgi:3,4-dihydroxy 2-butanone 4-phosphate synthase / GTP cyclohydrolase II
VGLNTTYELIQDIAAGRMIVLMDDEDRENEGDIVMSASHISADAINFMAQHARGLICLTLEQEQAQKLQLSPMVANNKAPLQTNFTVSIDAASGITTGISAADRARTIQAAVAEAACTQDIVEPGHIFPLVAQLGGVLRRAGHTEAGCDLAKLAGLMPAAVIVEIMNPDGTMARRGDLEKFAAQHKLKIGTIADLIAYRNLHEVSVQAIGRYTLATKWGEFTATVYRDLIKGGEHLALTMGEIKGEQVPAVRVHAASLFKDVLQVQQSITNNWTLCAALEYISQQNLGVAVLLNDSNPPLTSALTALQGGVKKAAGHSYSQIGIGSQILRDLGIKKMHLLSNPTKFSALSGFDLEIEKFIEFTPELLST